MRRHGDAPTGTATTTASRSRLSEATIAVGEQAACLLAATVHEGGYDDIGHAYRSLGRWIAAQDRTLAGPAEERYLVPPAPGVPAAAFRTEIAWPVRPSASFSHASARPSPVGGIRPPARSGRQSSSSR